MQIQSLLDGTIRGWRLTSGNLRSERSFRIIHVGLAAVRRRPAFHVVDFSILGNHAHHARGAEARPRGERFETNEVAEAQTFDHIEVFYNRQRRHSASAT